jgi:hypothetical protein
MGNLCHDSWSQVCSLALRRAPCPRAGPPGPASEPDALEKQIWSDVVDALPAHWLDLAGQLILRRLVAQAAIAERREARLRQLRAQDQDSGEDADAIAALHGVSAKTVAYLLSQLRATPRSRIVSRSAGPQFDEAPKSRPWEIRARA